MIRLVVLLVTAAAAAALAGAGTPASTAMPHVVRCHEIIDRTAFPYLGRPRYRYQTVLGAFSAPPAHLQTAHHPDAKIRHVTVVPARGCRVVVQERLSAPAGNGLAAALA